MKRILLGACVGLAFALAPAIAGATVILNFTGNVYNPGDPDCPPPGVGCENQNVDFEAQLTIAGGTLTIVLSNNSAATTAGPYSLLTSFYFAITGDPTLTYVSATGDVYLTDKDAADGLDTAGADLLADTAGDNTYQFRQGLTLDPGSPGGTILTYGVGTAGNSSLSPNGFSGNIVDGMDYGIYAGDIGSQNLDGKLLVKTTATFVFSGLTGYTEADISDTALFGLGTQPDSTGLVPEPSTTLLMATGLAGLVWLGRRRLS